MGAAARTKRAVSPSREAEQVAEPAPQAKPRCVQDLEQLLLEHIERRLADERLLKSAGPIFLFGAGRHTWWLLGRSQAAGRLNITAIIDDAAGGEEEIGGLPVLTLAQGLARFGLPHAVVLSTDAWQATMTKRARAAYGAKTRVVDLYKGLPPGPYLRGEGAYVRGVERSIMRPTEVCLRRSAAAMAPWMRARGFSRPLLIGRQWQTFAAMQAMREAGLKPALRAAEADCAIVCDEAIERAGAGGAAVGEAARGVSGPTLTMRTGERPWFDRSRDGAMKLARPSDERVRIVIRHDNMLGDVILSQGILPERIKTELYPNAHIVFATTRSAASRHGSASTGWCLDLIAENPWIDERVAVEDGGERLRGDLEYFISDSGDVYDHVFDHHAMKVEAPPGRTDARVYLAEADLAVAQRVLDGARRPLVAVNMNLVGDRFRAWGEEKTAHLCRAIEEQVRGTVVWIGWTDWRGYRRLAEGDRPLTVREQAAVLSMCDVHVAAQGAGANLSAAVGRPTLSLTGCHPARREGVAFFNNAYIEDETRRHVELSRYDGRTRVCRGAGEAEPDWAIAPGHQDTSEELFAFARELWDRETPHHRLPDQERFNRVRALELQDVLAVLVEMLSRRGAT